MKCLIYNYTNPLDSLILAATAFVSKASDILNTYVIPYNVVKELPHNLHNKLTPKLANTADLSKISKSNCSGLVHWNTHAVTTELSYICHLGEKIGYFLA